MGDNKFGFHSFNKKKHGKFKRFENREMPTRQTVIVKNNVNQIMTTKNNTKPLNFFKKSKIHLWS